MSNTLLIVALVFVVGTLAVVGYALYAMSPFARHDDVYHDPGIRQDSPRLD